MGLFVFKNNTMSKEFIKITFEDIEIAERFFDNKKHLSEFLAGVIDYYRGSEPQIKTKIVSKYFETYKKTMNNILSAKTFGFKGHSKKVENQQVKKTTLEGCVEGVVKESLSANNKQLIINNKLLNINNKNVAKKPLVEYQPCLDFWLKEFHPDWTFGGMQGKALKSLIKKIEKLRKNENDSIVEIFKVICLKLPDWYKDKDLPIIDSKFNEIIEQIKTQNNGKSTSKTNDTIAGINRILAEKGLL